MVKVTIFVEGDNPKLNQDALTVGAGTSFREAFFNLFHKVANSYDLGIQIQSLGSINRTRNILENTRDSYPESNILIDLDWPKKRKEERLINNYAPSDWPRIFFMIQEMEAWILSQPDKIELFGKNNKLIRKKGGIEIKESPNLKDKIIEDIIKPSNTLKRILKDYFKTKTGH